MIEFLRPDSERTTVATTKCTKGGCKLDGGRRMPGAGLSRRSPRKAPLGQSAFQPYWGKPAVRNDRGGSRKRRHHSKPDPRLDPTRPTVWTGRALQAEFEKMEGVGLAHLYPALAWSVCAPGHHGYPRAPDLILGKALRGRLGHQITGTTARPFLHFLNPTRRPRQVVHRLRQGSASDIPSAGPNALILCDLWLDARFVAATLCQHSPSDPRQLIGECGCQDVMV